MATTPQPVQPVRTITKGTGAFVNEIYTDPETIVIVRVNSYTAAQLNSMSSQIDAQVAAQRQRITEMLALLA